MRTFSAVCCVLCVRCVPPHRTSGILFGDQISNFKERDSAGSSQVDHRTPLNRRFSRRCMHIIASNHAAALLSVSVHHWSSCCGRFKGVFGARLVQHLGYWSPEGTGQALSQIIENNKQYCEIMSSNVLDSLVKVSNNLNCRDKSVKVTCLSWLGPRSCMLT